MDQKRTVIQVQTNSISLEKWEFYIETLFRKEEKIEGAIENIDLKEIENYDNITQ